MGVCVRARACVRTYVGACVPGAQQPSLPRPLPFYSWAEPAQSPRCIVGKEGCSAGRAVVRETDGRQEVKLTAEGQGGGRERGV